MQFSDDGEMPVIPPDLRSLMIETGRRWGDDVAGHVRLMTERFSEVLRAAPEQGVRVDRDVAYGEHPRQRYDVYQPVRPDPRRPVLAFIHGGAFVEGDRNKTGEIYSNVLRYFARNGVLGVNIGYRLAGDARFPGASEDIALALAHVRAHAATLGCDPVRLFLMGHSAGGAHAASCAYDPRFSTCREKLIRGLVIVSGRVRAETLPDNPNAAKVVAYYGSEDPAFLSSVSPVSMVGPDSPPTFVAWAEFENPLIDMHCAELVFRLSQARRRAPPIMWLKGHNHTSAIGHFNTQENALGRAILTFIWETG